MEIGYLGPVGSFSFIATNEIKKLLRFDLSLKNYSSFQDLFKVLSLEKVDSILFPIENTAGGSVIENTDRFLRLSDQFVICLEYILGVNHCLLGFAKDFRKIKRIKGHYQAFMQCEGFLKNKFSQTKLETEEERSSSQAVSSLLDLEKDSKFETVAIGPEESAKIYNVPIIEKNIQDSNNNFTRFWLVTKKNHPCKSKTGEKFPQSNKITSLVFKIPFDRAGSLYEVLSIFASCKINLSKIESRPTGLGLFSYIFLIDFVNPESWDLLRDKVFKELKKRCLFFRILGESYPVIFKEKN